MSQHSEMNPDTVPLVQTRECGSDSQTTVYFDGSCPLCAAEIRHYRAREGSEQLDFVDVAEQDSDLGPNLTQDKAMARFHIRLPDGQLLSGASAFVAIWQVLPGWHWAARLASIPGVIPTMEGAYRMFLPIRPILSACLGKMISAMGTDQSTGTSNRNRK